MKETEGTKQGILYGVGVGPGDPELLTLKAVRILRECDVIAIPQESKEGCTAYQIARQAVPELDEKPCLPLPMPMTKDREKLAASHEAAAAKAAEQLAAGRTVALITLGDATVYSTYLYVHERIKCLGFETRIVNGVPSFCAAAARLDMPLVNGSQKLHILPASYHIEEALELPGVKVLMKSGRQMPKVKALLKEKGLEARMVENCGMEGEKTYQSLEEIPDDAGYFSLLIAESSEEKQGGQRT